LLKNQDFIIITKDGQSVMSLGESKQKVVKDRNGVEFMLNPLKSCNELLLEETNHLKFIKKSEEKIIISV